MLLITILSEFTVTFDPSWTVTRTGRVEEKVTPANLKTSGSEVDTCRIEGGVTTVINGYMCRCTCAKFATSKTADLAEDASFALASLPVISCIPLSFSVGGETFLTSGGEREGCDDSPCKAKKPCSEM